MSTIPATSAPGRCRGRSSNHLAIIYLPLITVLYLCSTSVLMLYRIDRARHEDNLERLAQAAALEAQGDHAARPAPRHLTAVPLGRRTGGMAQVVGRAAARDGRIARVTETASAPRLGLATKVTYGFGSVAQATAGVALGQGTITYFLIRVVGMRPALVALIILLSLAADAIFDPLLGRLSDTLRTPWGAPSPVHVRLSLSDRARDHLPLASAARPAAGGPGRLRAGVAGAAASQRQPLPDPQRRPRRRSWRPTITSAPA